MALNELILNALVLERDENVVFDSDATYIKPDNKGSPNGKLIFTQKRLFFITVTGIFSKTANIIISCNYSDMVGVTLKTTLFIIKRLVFSVHLPHGNTEFVFQLNHRAQETYEQARELVNQAIHEKTVEAKVVLIKETKEQNPLKILQNKLARGEITTEEFHKRVQRL